MRKVSFIQPDIPHYREQFFEKLSALCELSVYHSGIKENENGDPTYKIVRVKRYNLLGKIYYQLIPILSLIKNNDTIIINGNLRYLSSMFLLIICAITRKRIVWWGHLASAHGSKIWIVIRILISRMASSIIYYTEYEAEIAIKYYNAPKKKTFFLSNGLDLEQIKNLREKYNVEKRKTDILFCGRFTQKSKLPDLINALKLINKPLQVLLIGDEFGDFKKYDLRQIKHHEIKVLGKITDENELCEYFNRTKIFVYPGSAGLSIIHAASYGVPVLVSDKWSGHMPEITLVRDYLGGATFNFGNTTDFAKMIIHCLENKILLKKLSENGIQACEDTFNIDAMIKNISAIIYE